MCLPNPSTRGVTISLALLLFGLQTPGRSQNSIPAPTASNAAPARRVYSRLLDPREHPDYDRRAVKPPSWDTFKRRTQFTCLRGFTVNEDRIVGYAEEIEKFSRTHQLGDVVWPSYPILFAKNLGDLADEIKRRDLYLFDIWGYVPGSGPGGYWQQFKPPAEAFAILESKLGERWLGTDIGEQDGRYIGGYANQMTPAAAGRFDQYLNFQRHFERMGDDLGHKHATLVSLNFGHYFLKEATYTLIGAETAQALPNNQVYYAFIRGAGKQYGVPWFGNASIFNRWGFKTYGSAGKSDGYEHGPTKGTSLSLMKRLLYSHVLYNCVAVGFENGWLEGDALSPIGRIQQSAQRWVAEHGQPGVLHTPVALLLDFYSGWSFPRHLYSENVYRVWGNLPYNEGDCLTDAVLDLLYRRYQDSSFFHDESGFITSTPYGDIADCLLSDAPQWLLARYPVVVAAGELGASRELQDKLSAYVERGGHLVVTAGNLAKFKGGLCGVTATRPPDAPGMETAWGRGRLTTLASAWGIDIPEPSGPPPRSAVDRPLPKPYRLRPEVRRILCDLLARQRLFDLDNTNLSLITCRKGPGEYTLGVLNNTWREQPYRIVSRCGEVESLRLLPLDDSEKTAVGYVPEGVDRAALGTGGEQRIVGGDVRLFAVRVRESGIEEIPHRAPAPRPRHRLLPLRALRSIKEEILARPTFFEHFDGVVVDWRYVREREQQALAAEAGWIRRQGLRVWVDLSSGVNLFPTLRLIDNLPGDYAASMATLADVQAKMERVGAQDLILSLHRHPENNFSGDQTRAAFDQTLRELAAQAARRRQRLHLRLAFGKPPWNLDEAAQLLDRIGATNLFLAASTALLAETAPSPQTLKAWGPKLGLWLGASPRYDVAGRLWDVHAPLHQAGAAQTIRNWLALASQVPVALDAVYSDLDAEYLDAAILDRWRVTNPNPDGLPRQPNR